MVLVNKCCLTAMTVNEMTAIYFEVNISLSYFVLLEHSAKAENYMLSYHGCENGG